MIGVASRKKEVLSLKFCIKLIGVETRIDIMKYLHTDWHRWSNAKNNASVLYDERPNLMQIRPNSPVFVQELILNEFSICWESTKLLLLKKILKKSAIAWKLVVVHICLE